MGGQASNGCDEKQTVWGDYLSGWQPPYWDEYGNLIMDGKIAVAEEGFTVGAPAPAPGAAPVKAPAKTTASMPPDKRELVTRDEAIRRAKATMLQAHADERVADDDAVALIAREADEIKAALQAAKSGDDEHLRYWARHAGLEIVDPAIVAAAAAIGTVPHDGKKADEYDDDGYDNELRPDEALAYADDDILGGIASACPPRAGEIKPVAGGDSYYMPYDTAAEKPMLRRDRVKADLDDLRRMPITTLTHGGDQVPADIALLVLQLMAAAGLRAEIDTHDADENTGALLLQQWAARDGEEVPRVVDDVTADANGLTWGSFAKAHADAISRWRGETRSITDQICYRLGVRRPNTPAAWTEACYPGASAPDETARDERRWVIEGIAREGDTIMLSGPAKTGKTWCAQAISESVALGEPILGLRTTKCPVIHFSFENNVSFETQLRGQMFRRAGFLASAGGSYKVVQCFDGVDVGVNPYLVHRDECKTRFGVDALQELIADYVQHAHDDNPGCDGPLVVLDNYRSLASLFASANKTEMNENSADAVNAVFRAIADVRAEHPTMTILLLHHFNRSGECYAGSGAFESTPAAHLEMQRIDTGAFSAPAGKNTDGDPQYIVTADALRCMAAEAIADDRKARLANADSLILQREHEWPDKHLAGNVSAIAEHYGVAARDVPVMVIPVNFGGVNRSGDSRMRIDGYVCTFTTDGREDSSLDGIGFFRDRRGYLGHFPADKNPSGNIAKRALEQLRRDVVNHNAQRREVNNETDADIALRKIFLDTDRNAVTIAAAAAQAGIDEEDMGPLAAKAGYQIEQREGSDGKQHMMIMQKGE